MGEVNGVEELLRGRDLHQSPKSPESIPIKTPFRDTGRIGHGAPAHKNTIQLWTSLTPPQRAHKRRTNTWIKLRIENARLVFNFISP